MAVKAPQWMNSGGSGGRVIATSVWAPWIAATDLTTLVNGTPDATYVSDLASPLATKNVIQIPKDATYLEINPVLNLSAYSAAPVIQVWTRDSNGVYQLLQNVNGATPVLTGTPVEANASPLTYVVPAAAANDFRFDLRGCDGNVIVLVTTAGTGSSIVSPLYVKFL